MATFTVSAGASATADVITGRIAEACADLARAFESKAAGAATLADKLAHKRCAKSFRLLERRVRLARLDVEDILDGRTPPGVSPLDV